MKTVITQEQLYEPIFIDQPNSQGSKVTGCAVLDEEERILRLPTEWLTTYTGNASIGYSTAGTYSRNLKYFIEYLNTIENIAHFSVEDKLIQVGRRILENYIRFEYNEKGTENGTVRNRETALRSFYGFISDGEYIPPVIASNPFPTKWISKKPHQKQVQSASIHHLIELMHQSKYERERVALQFMYDSGVRISELGRVKVRHIQDAMNFVNYNFRSQETELMINPDYAPILIIGSKARKQSFKERTSIITHPTLKRITEYHSKPLFKRYQRLYQDPLECPAFLNSEGNPFNAVSIGKLIERLSEKANKQKKIKRRISPHLFRHGSAYMTLQDENLGADALDRLLNVQRSLGHSHAKTSERYTSVPAEIYNIISRQDGVELRSKLDKMQEVYDQTKLPIKIGDRK